MLILKKGKSRHREAKSFAQVTQLVMVDIQSNPQASSTYLRI